MISEGFRLEFGFRKTAHFYMPATIESKDLSLLCMKSTTVTFLHKNVNRKVQEEPQAEAAAKPGRQGEEKKWHRLTCA